MAQQPDTTAALKKEAYAAFDRGCLAEASSTFAKLLAADPDNRGLHYMQGLVHKYLLDWPTSLAHNLAAIALDDKVGEAEHWNAAIAASGLRDWQQARALWQALGIRLPEGSGPIVDDFGVAVVRLNAWSGGETVWMRRICPVRARLLNVPLPESGHRFGDIVLHDGASTGFRWDGEHKLNVFNELQRLEASDFATHVVFVHSPRAEDLDALRNATAPGIGYVEDWTDTVRHLCLRCSYGVPHRHDAPQINDDWAPGRNLGIAAQSRKAVMKLLKDWQKGGEGRHIDGVETSECPVPEREDGHVWWRDPNEDETPDEDEASDAGPA